MFIKISFFLVPIIQYSTVQLIDLTGPPFIIINILNFWKKIESCQLFREEIYMWTASRPALANVRTLVIGDIHKFQESCTILKWLPTKKFTLTVQMSLIKSQKNYSGNQCATYLGAFSFLLLCLIVESKIFIKLAREKGV